MSEHDDALLDEDLGDEEYDLGNEEEDALLADDIETERLAENSRGVIKGDEEVDDVLDLGITDPIVEDVEVEKEEVKKTRRRSGPSSGHKKRPRPEPQHWEPKVISPTTNIVEDQQPQPIQAKESASTELPPVEQTVEEEGTVTVEAATQEFKDPTPEPFIEATTTNDRMEPDLREKLKKKTFKRQISLSESGADEDENEEPKERRNRFKNERNLDDTWDSSLDNDYDQRWPEHRMNRDRPRRGRGSGKYEPQPPVRYQPAPPPAHPGYRPDSHPVDYHYSPTPPQSHQPYGPPHHLQNGAPPMYHGEMRPPPPQGPYQPPMRPPGPPRMDFGPIPLPPGTGPPAPQYMGPRPPMMPPGPYPQGPGAPYPGPPRPQFLAPPGTYSLPSKGGPQPMPGPQFPRQPLQNRPQVPPSYPPQHYEQNRPQHYYNETRPPYGNQPPPPPPTSQYETRPPYSSQGPEASKMIKQDNNPPAGHKILINPHFKGNPVLGDGKSIKNVADEFVQALNKHDQAKTDDPIAYFSDMWKENKSYKPSCSRRSYSPEPNYSKSSSYNSHNRGRTNYNDRDSHRPVYREPRPRDHYRDRDSPPRKSRSRSPPRLPPRPRSYSRSRSPPPRQRNGNLPPPPKAKRESDYHDDSKKLPLHRSIKPRELPKRDNRNVPQKRPLPAQESTEKLLREESPKKSKAVIKVTPIQNMSKTKMSPNKEENVDPEMKSYQEKMEEQKRLREKVLKEKENRRKIAAMKEAELKIKKEPIEEPVKENPSFDVARKKVKVEKVKPMKQVKREVVKKPKKIRLPELTEEDLDFLSASIDEEFEEHFEDDDEVEEEEEELEEEEEEESEDGAETYEEVYPEPPRRVIIANPKKVVQKSKPIATKRTIGLIRKIISPQKPKNKVKVAKSELLAKTVGNSLTHAANVRKRIVLGQPSVRSEKESSANVAYLHNLSPATSENKIKRMCETVGKIKSIQVGDGDATIVFKTATAAAAFFKKYHKRKIDLSTMQVRLIPQSKVLLSSDSEE